MRHLTLVEQDASYDDGSQTFTLGASVPGRLTWPSGTGAEAGNHVYRAATADESQWEIGVGNFDGTTSVQRSTILRSSTGSPVAFTAAVRLTLIAPAAAMWSIDSPYTARSAFSQGEGAMAAGLLSSAIGEGSMAVGLQALVGESGSPADYAMALGPYASARHVAAVSIGPDAESFLPGATHLRRSFWWSAGEGYTDDASSIFLTAAWGTRPVLPVNSAAAIKAIVAGKNTASSEYFAAEIKGMVRRGASGAAIIVGTPVTETIYATPGITVAATLALDGSAGGFGVQITGQAGKVWDWSAELRGVWV